MSEVAEQLPITRWIADLKDGDAEAARQLWDQYYQRVLSIAHVKLGPLPRRVEDEEDLAVSVFDSVFRGAADGRFPLLSDRADLWHLLAAITTNKAVDSIRRTNRFKRGSGRVRGDSVFLGDSARFPVGFDSLPGESDPPDLAMIFHEEHRRLVSLLRNDTLREIAHRKIEGCSNRQIAETLGISEHAVGRKVRLIRMKWSEELTRAVEE